MEDTDEKQLSGFGSRGGQIRPLLHVQITGYISNGSRCENTRFRIFRPIKTQTMLLSYKDKLEYRNFACSYFNYYSFNRANKNANQTADWSVLRSELPRRIPGNPVESDHGCTSRILFDNACDNVTLTSQKP